MATTTRALDDPVIQLAAFVGLLSGCLALASWCSTAYKLFPIHKWLLHWINVRRLRRGLSNYIPHMTPKEREIIAYLLAHNQKTFTAESDGGHAATLLGRGIVTVIAQPGEHLDPEHVPMTIPDSLWDVQPGWSSSLIYRLERSIVYVLTPALAPGSSDA
jgi:hypothetical protein